MPALLLPECHGWLVLLEGQDLCTTCVAGRLNTATTAAGRFRHCGTIQSTPAEARRGISFWSRSFWNHSIHPCGQLAFRLAPDPRVSTVSRVTGIGLPLVLASQKCERSQGSGAMVAKRTTVVSFGLASGPGVSKGSTVTGIDGVLPQPKHK